VCPPRTCCHNLRLESRVFGGFQHRSEGHLRGKHVFDAKRQGVRMSQLALAINVLPDPWIPRNSSSLHAACGGQVWQSRLVVALRRASYPLHISDQSRASCGLGCSLDPFLFPALPFAAGNDTVRLSRFDPLRHLVFLFVALACNMLQSHALSPRPDLKAPVSGDASLGPGMAQSNQPSFGALSLPRPSPCPDRVTAGDRSITVGDASRRKQDPRKAYAKRLCHQWRTMKPRLSGTLPLIRQGE